MIENEKQYAITKSRILTFEQALVSYKTYPKKQRFLSQAMIESVESQLETFKEEIAEYEAKRTETPASSERTVK